MIDYFDHIKWTSLWGPIQQNLEDSLIHWMVHIDADVLNLFYKKKKKKNFDLTHKWGNCQAVFW